MLSDFDDLDKNMGDAEHIFENTDEIHSYDTADYLSEDQKEALKRFFSNFSDDDSKVKQNFAQLWNNLGAIYTSFRDSLRKQGIAYEGMLYRDVAEELKTATANTKHLTPNTHYLFVGFNLIQPVEQELMAYLKREGKAAFYWDYDNYYMADGNEAGRYIKSYLSAFPNEITIPEAFNNFTNKPGKVAKAAAEAEGKEIESDPHYYMKEACFFSASQVSKVEAKKEAPELEKVDSYIIDANYIDNLLAAQA
jgi:hypothetical protein